MEDDLVVKSNALINASYSLSLVEQRLILLSIVVIRNNSHKVGSITKLISIPASDYINMYNVDPSSAYKSLKEACKTLFARQFSYQEQRGNGKIANLTSRWVQKIGYIDNSATVEFTFADDVIPLITELQKHFTSYEIKQTAHLTSGYAVRLYELLIAWRSAGKTPQIKLDEFRDKIGVLKHEYPRMDNFKRIVLDPAIKQINAHTDLTISCEQHKTGRVITAFSFKLKQKEVKKPIEHKEGNKDQNTPDLFHKMTEAQLDTFLSKLADLGEVQAMANVGEEMPSFKARLRSMLKDPEKQKKLIPYLKQVGFSQKTR